MLISDIGLRGVSSPTVWLTPDVVLATVSDLVSSAQDSGLESSVSDRQLPDLPPPYGTVQLDGPAGPMRLAAYRRRADGQSGTDVVALAEMLDAVARRRLLDFLIGFCRTAFRLTSDGGYASACAQVAMLCCEGVEVAKPIAALLHGRVLLRGVRLEVGDTLYLVGPQGTRLVQTDRALDHGDAFSPGANSSLLILAAPCHGDRLMAVGRIVRVWQLAEPATLPHVLALTGEDLAGARDACLRALALAPPASVEAVLLREIQILCPAAARRHDDPALPIGGSLELAIPDGDGGVFLAGWLRDPLDLIAGAELTTPAGRFPVSLEALHRVSRPDLSAMLAKAAHSGMGVLRPGFIARLPDPTSGAALQPTLRLLLHSGAAIDLTPPLRPLAPNVARDVVLSSVRAHELVPEMLEGCLAPAAASLHRLARSARGAERLVRIGKPSAKPPVSILVPIYRNLGFLRFQMAAFSEDRACRASEIIYALDSPEQAHEVEHLLRGLNHLYDLHLSLVVMDRNSGFAATINAAARAAHGKRLLLLNSDVIPARPGWLDLLRAAQARTGAAAATAKLLFDDGSLQHAGLYFARDPQGRWFNNHYCKGMPRHWPGANLPCRVPGGTGAALLIDRRRFEAVGGVCEDYIVGDYEDSDLCLRLQENGGTIVYEPRAELFHFERRSILLHTGYTRTLACQYNRHIHHQKWDGAMTALMTNADFQPIPRTPGGPA